jgi:hypothetical protein
MNRNITKTSVAFLFAALFMVAVGSAQAAESVWFSGNELYQPATHLLNDGSCYNIAKNSENIYLSTDSSLNQEAIAGICSLTDGRSFSIWFPPANT